jgi:hypothetical protein
MACRTGNGFREKSNVKCEKLACFTGYSVPQPSINQMLIAPTSAGFDSEENTFPSQSLLRLLYPHCQLLIADCILPVAYCSLPLAN